MSRHDTAGTHYDVLTDNMLEHSVVAQMVHLNLHLCLKSLMERGVHKDSVRAKSADKYNCQQKVQSCDNCTYMVARDCIKPLSEKHIQNRSKGERLI